MELNPRHLIIIFIILCFIFMCHYYFAKELITVIYTKKYKDETSAKSQNQTHNAVYGKLQRAEASGIYIFKHRKMSPSDYKNPRDLEFAFVRYLADIEIGCSSVIKLGIEGWGSWDICLSGPFALKEPCLIYSFGIGFDWTFDDAVSATFNCTVRAFDPSMDTENHTRITENSTVHFYNVGIGDKDIDKGQDPYHPKWMLRRFSALYKALDPPVNNQQPLLDYLKIDVEGFENKAIKAMFLDEMLPNVKQIGLEIHRSKEAKSVKSMWNFLEMLEMAGFRKWHLHLNSLGRPSRSNWTGRWRHCCYELVYVNKKFIGEDVTHVNYSPVNDIIL